MSYQLMNAEEARTLRTNNAIKHILDALARSGLEDVTTLSLGQIVVSNSFDIGQNYLTVTYFNDIFPTSVVPANETEEDAKLRKKMDDTIKKDIISDILQYNFLDVVLDKGRFATETPEQQEKISSRLTAVEDTLDKLFDKFEVYILDNQAVYSDFTVRNKKNSGRIIEIPSNENGKFNSTKIRTRDERVAYFKENREKKEQENRPAHGQGRYAGVVRGSVRAVTERKWNQQSPLQKSRHVQQARELKDVGIRRLATSVNEADRTLASFLMKAQRVQN